jgi:hypothetical protein
MRFVPLRYLLLGILLLFVVSHVARAQDLTVFVGGQMPGSVTVNSLKTALDNGPIYGVRISSGFAAFLRLEHTFAFSNDFLFPSRPPGVDRSKGFLFNSNLLANIPVGKVVPYATVGLGLIHQYGSENLPVGTKFAINYGGGLKFPKLLGPAGLRLDARGYTATGVFSRSVNIFEISGGLLISF